MLPYSIGLNRSQSPPGLRKSGIPDSAEIPAPVIAIVFVDWQIAWAALLIVSVIISSKIRGTSGLTVLALDHNEPRKLEGFNTGAGGGFKFPLDDLDLRSSNLSSL